MIEHLFFELIQVSLGTRICLSHTPGADEWGELYSMAKKQSLVGVCFAGVQRLSGIEDSINHKPYTINLQEVLYLQWMGMAAKIQQRNEVVTRQCVELQARLSADGLSSVVLKGQGVASLYTSTGSAQVGDLRGLRQSGDIDVWVLPNEGESDDEHIARVVKYAKGVNSDSHFSGKHIDLSVFSDTEVELHVTPAKMNCPWNEKRLKAWFQEVSCGSKFQEVNGFKVPDTAFNLVYLLLHCYDHLLFEGVGLRQVMDYYMVLRAYFKTKTLKTPESIASICDDEIMSKLPSSSSQKSATVCNGSDILSGKKQEKQNPPIQTVKDLGLLKFASAMMWVLGHVFAMEREYMICEPNEKEGRFLLNEIMTGGNFGKYGKDGVMVGHAKGKMAFFMARMKRNWRFLRHYPSEIIWSPYAMFVHFVNNKK